MSTTLTKINNNAFSLRFVTSQYDSPTSVFSDSSISGKPAIRMCIRKIMGPIRNKIAVFLFYGALGESIFDVTAVLNLKRANGSTGEATTMHNIYNLELYAYGFACFLDLLQLKSQGYTEDNKITFECIVTINPEVQQKKIHNFEIEDPVLGNAVLHVDGKKFYVNKRFLSISSKLFGKNTNDSKCIGLIIDDVKYDEFEQFLQCLYSSKNIDSNNLESVYKLANRYSANCLINQCKKFHRSNADINKSTKLEHSETYKVSNRPRGVFDDAEDKAKPGKLLYNPHSFDDSTVVELLTRMQESVKLAIQQKEKYNCNIKDPVLSDAVLIVEGKKFYARKEFLSTQSSVFKTLFFQDYNYSLDYGYGCITEHTIDKVKHKEFEQFLQGIYSTKNINKNNIVGVLSLARRFKVHSLMDQCENFLISSADIHKSAKLMCSDQYNFPNLQTAVLNSIKDSAEIKSLSTKWYSHALLKKIREITF